MVGKLFIISAPSGAGKTTLVNAVLNRVSVHYSIERVITYTTKQPRSGEINGRDYNFLSPTAFEQKIKEGFFLEWSTAYGTYYGSPRSIVDQRAQGKSFILIIDRRGAEQVAKQIDQAVLIWIYTNNLDILRERLQKRGAENSAQIAARLIQAQKEIELEQQNRLYTYHVLNDDFNDAVGYLESLISEELINSMKNAKKYDF
jgi:guanylate kinase